VGQEIRRGKESYEKDVRQSGGSVLPPEASRAKEHQESEADRKEHIWNFGGLVLEIGRAETPITGPEADGTVEGGPDEDQGMLADEVDSQSLFFGEVADLSGCDKLLHLDGIAGRMGPAVVGFERAAIVAGPGFEPEVISDWGQDVEGAVVADSPGSEDGE